MSTKPELGKNFFNQNVQRGRNAAKEARETLRQLIETDPGPQTRTMLYAKLTLKIGTLDEVVTEFDNIGKTAKELIPDS